MSITSLEHLDPAADDAAALCGLGVPVAGLGVPGIQAAKDLWRPASLTIEPWLKAGESDAMVKTVCLSRNQNTKLAAKMAQIQLTVMKIPVL